MLLVALLKLAGTAALARPPPPAAVRTSTLPHEHTRAVTLPSPVPSRYRHPTPGSHLDGGAVQRLGHPSLAAHRRVPVEGRLSLDSGSGGHDGGSNWVRAPPEQPREAAASCVPQHPPSRIHEA